MEAICEIEQCTGCGLCVSQCPKQAIQLCVKDKLGHLYPYIDSELCVDCGLCNKICPALHPCESKMPVTAYAAWSKDEVDYKSSTSGGVASVMSQYIIDHGGVVYGCAMLPDIDVKHVRVTEKSGIGCLKGSKYVQSSIVDIIPQLRVDVHNKKLTLFIGTPCQVAAIKSLYKELPDNLFLVDLICHGVPSLKLLKQHIRKVADYPHYDTVLFREGTGIYVIIVVDGKEVYRQALKQPRFKDFYINAFFDGYTYRDSCYHCNYARPKRVSDITIGDFWGLGKRASVDSIPPHPFGCSLILPSTEKGQEFVKAITPHINLYERTLEEAVEGNNQLRTPFKKGFRISLFRKLFPLIGPVAYKLLTVDKSLVFRTKTVIKKIIR